MRRCRTNSLLVNQLPASYIAGALLAEIWVTILLRQGADGRPVSGRKVFNMPVAIAKQLLAKFWDGRLPVDPDTIARSCGVQVDPKFGLDGASGMFEYVGDVPVISYSVTESSVRQRFTIAHELGHWALRHGRSFRDEPSNFSTSSYSPKEKAANQFAAELLMPSDAVNVAIAQQRISDIGQLAKMFNVSQVAMKYRLQNLGWL